MATTTAGLSTLDQTFSFYVSGSEPNRIRTCAEKADAVVVAGPSGPASVRRLRSEGWSGLALFDRGGYATTSAEVEAERWMDEQVSAGADRLLTPGSWISADPGHSPFLVQADNELELARRHGATCVLGLDYRWLTKSALHDQLLDGFSRLPMPVALVLGHRDDPLGRHGAVDALVAVTKRVQRLSLLRIDHAGIGALAFNATHVSLGLTPTHRHAVPPGKQAFAIPHDRSARVFVKDLMDWFTASTIGGWSTMKVSPTCALPCCNGQRIDRFLDERRKTEADLHNRIVLSEIAEYILTIPEPAARRRAFGSMCFKAVERYGVLGGLTSEIKPKAQLVQWAQYS